MADCLQSRSSAGSGTSLALSFLSDTTTGSLFVAGIGAAAGGSTNVSASDNKSNTYTPRGTVNAGATIEAAICETPGGTGGAGHQVTGASSSSADIEMVICEYSGVEAVSAFDQSATNTGSGTSASTGTTATLAQADELVVGFAYSYGSLANVSAPTLDTDGPVGSTALLRREQDGTAESVGLADKSVADTAGTSITFTWAASEDWIACVATFKLSAAAAGVPFVLLSGRTGFVLAGR